MMTAPLFISADAERSIFAIRFKPTGVAAFLRHALGEIQDARPGAIHVWPELNSIQAPILEAPCDAARCAIAEAFLVHRLHPAWVDRRATAAVELLCGGTISIAHTATMLEISRQHLHRLFFDQVGLSPKSFARVARVRRAMRLSLLGDGNAAGIAVEAGFADQPHMIREFRSITGSTLSLILTSARCRRRPPFKKILRLDSA
jgi:AraC-like DNA-binding protein